MSEKQEAHPIEWKFSEPEGGSARVYANQAQLFWSGVDVTVVFGELLQDPDTLKNGVLSVEHKVKVTLPWAVAKMLAANIQDIVSRYEANNETQLKLPGAYVLP